MPIGLFLRASVLQAGVEGRLVLTEIDGEQIAATARRHPTLLADQRHRGKRSF